MSNWTHRMCGECWIERNLKLAEHEFRIPVQVRGTPEGTCCFCNGDTRMGIFVRHDPKELKCVHAMQREVPPETPPATEGQGGTGFEALAGSLDMPMFEPTAPPDAGSGWSEGGLSDGGGYSGGGGESDGGGASGDF